MDFLFFVGRGGQLVGMATLCDTDASEQICRSARTMSQFGSGAPAIRPCRRAHARFCGPVRNTVAAAGYWVWNLRAGLEQETGSWRFREFARLDNLANRSYVGSVIVNESNARYFEAAPGRVAYIMFNAAWRVN